jgi:peptidoglycan hydrolase CwlO-like protein
MKWIFCYLFLCSSAFAQIKSGYLTQEDQKYYKNDIMEGNNQRERIDSLVKEVNKIYSEFASLKAEIKLLNKEIEELKKSK